MANQRCLWPPEQVEWANQARNMGQQIAMGKKT